MASKIRPLKFGLKYQPPSIILEYQLGEKKRRRVMPVRGLEPGSDVHDIVDQLIEAHSQLDPGIVPTEQVVRLVQKLIANTNKTTSPLIKEPPKETLKEIPKEPLKEPFKPSPLPIKDIPKESPKELPKESPKEPLKESPKLPFNAKPAPLQPLSSLPKTNIPNGDANGLAPLKKDSSLKDISKETTSNKDTKDVNKDIKDTKEPEKPKESPKPVEKPAPTPTPTPAPASKPPVLGSLPGLGKLGGLGALPSLNKPPSFENDKEKEKEKVFRHALDSDEDDDILGDEDLDDLLDGDNLRKSLSDLDSLGSDNDIPASKPKAPTDKGKDFLKPVSQIGGHSDADSFASDDDLYNVDTKHGNGTHSPLDSEDEGINGKKKAPPATGGGKGAHLSDDDLYSDEFLEEVEEEEYHSEGEDLNKLEDEELNQHKAKMNLTFEKNRKLPGDPGFKYDVQKQFSSSKKSEWDEDEVDDDF